MTGAEDGGGLISILSQKVGAPDAAIRLLLTLLAGE